MDIFAVNFISDTAGDLKEVKIPIVSICFINFLFIFLMHYFK